MRLRLLVVCFCVAACNGGEADSQGCGGDRKLTNKSQRLQRWAKIQVDKMDMCVVTSALLALLLYVNTLPADFAYDDRLVTSHFNQSNVSVVYLFVKQNKTVAGAFNLEITLP